MTTISMAKLRDHVEAKKREIGWVDDDTSTDALRNKGGNRTSEKRAALARIDARAIAAGKNPTRSYY
jgi:hypothetical protein